MPKKSTKPTRPPQSILDFIVKMANEDTLNFVIGVTQYFANAMDEETYNIFFAKYGETINNMMKDIPSEDLGFLRRPDARQCISAYMIIKPRKTPKTEKAATPPKNEPDEERDVEKRLRARLDTPETADPVMLSFVISKYETRVNIYIKKIAKELIKCGLDPEIPEFKFNMKFKSGSKKEEVHEESKESEFKEEVHEEESKGSEFKESEFKEEVHEEESKESEFKEEESKESEFKEEVHEEESKEEIVAHFVSNAETLCIPAPENISIRETPAVISSGEKPSVEEIPLIPHHRVSKIKKDLYVKERLQFLENKLKPFFPRFKMFIRPAEAKKYTMDIWKKYDSRSDLESKIILICDAMKSRFDLNFYLDSLRDESGLEIDFTVYEDFEEIIDEYQEALLKRDIKAAQNLEKEYPEILCQSESMLERYYELHGEPEEWDDEDFYGNLEEEEESDSY